jgi:nicotinate-nucleotide pyrophosphorylase (carboxylating)
LILLPEGALDTIRRGLAEDIGEGDHTSLSSVPKGAMGSARCLVKERGVLAGVELAAAIFNDFDPELRFEQLITDGTEVAPGDEAFLVHGSSASILTSERLVLNFMQRMSGIATRTAAFVRELEGTGCRVLDTRKTTPTLRAFEKWAVRIGGGVNHRMGLYDMIMIKDNHVDYAGGISAAIENVTRYQKDRGLDLPVEIETRNISEVEQVLKCGSVNRIMLDNFSPEKLVTAVKLIDNRFETEASGGIVLDTARSYAETGVDFISVGALTHTIDSLDLSLKAIQ